MHRFLKSCHGLIIDCQAGVDPCRSNMYPHCLQEWLIKHIYPISVSQFTLNDEGHSIYNLNSALHEPKPEVVGIAWVVQCVEQRERVEGSRFKVELESISGDKAVRLVINLYSEAI